MKNFRYEALVYSALPDLTLGKLKKGEYPGDIAVEDLQYRFEKHELGWMIEGMPTYPSVFILMSQRPYLIYYQGNKDLLNKEILGIVGPRKMTSYSQTVLQKMFEMLKGRDVVTVSGLAEGVDTMCHEESLRHGIPTIAVLGGGFEYFFNSSKRTLIERIVQQGGLVISEFKISQQPMVYTFPQRNRIIAGLSKWLFLPEAGKNSGSLITADFARQMKKPVYGVPHSLWSEQSQGIHEYIKQGKMSLISDLQEWIDEILPHSFQKSSAVPLDLTEEERMIWEQCVDGNSYSLDQLADRLQWSPLQVMSVISILELKGLIYMSGPDQYQRC